MAGVHCEKFIIKKSDLPLEFKAFRNETENMSWWLILSSALYNFKEGTEQLGSKM